VERGELQVYKDSAEVAAAVADLFINVGQTALTVRGSFHVALSGGNTPRAAFELLAREPRSESLAWKDVFVYFGDERCVPPDDEQSNFRMAEETLLDAVPIPKHNVHRIHGETDPAEAARDYAKVLLDDMGDPPRFDLMLLGMGPDGHTASLFPGSSPEEDSDKLVRAVYAKSQMMWRVTLTPTVINASRVVAFAVEGVDKASTLCDVYTGPLDPVKYPSQIVAPTDGRLIWIVDKLAAGMIEGAAR
jgi:6-phosphogluconolactonase